MSWQFDNGTDEYGTFDAGAVPQNGAAISVWALLRPTVSNQGPISGRESGTGRVGFVTFANEMFVANGATPAFTVPLSEWIILGYDDHNAITATPRMHMCTDLAGTPTWSHADGSSGGDRSGVVDEWRIGHAFDLRMHGHIAAAAVADSRLGDAGFEALSLTDMADWVAQAVCAWQFNVAVGATAIVDLTGGGADQTAVTGTPTLDTGTEPPGWSYYTPGGGPTSSGRLGGVWVPGVRKARIGGVWVEA